MNVTTPRLLALVLAVTGALIFFNIASAGSLPNEIDKLFGKFIEGKQSEFLDPEEAFIISAAAVSENIINVHWQIAEGYYLYKNKFQFSLQGDDIDIIDVQLPEGKLKNDPDFGSVWVNYYDVDAKLTVQKKDDAASVAKLLVQYQGCKEDVLCYLPISKTLSINLITNVAGESAASEPARRVISTQDSITKNLLDDSFLKNIIIFFGFGLLLAFTPCVFPMIPILSGIIIGQGSTTTLRSFYMSLTYVIAMASTYAILGAIAGSFGLNLQVAAQDTWVITAFAGVFCLLALSMFGFYELQLPVGLQNKLLNVSSKQGGPLYGVAIMGVLSAIVVGPCIVPPLAAALLYISQSGDAVLGSFVLFAMGMGMGIPLLVIGTSAGKLLPKAGAWMESIKRICGVLMLGVAIWFMDRILPSDIILVLWAILFIVTVIFMAWLDRLEKFKRLLLWQKSCCCVVLAALVFLTLFFLLPKSGSLNTLSFQMVEDVDDLQSALNEAARDNKFVMLDFYADWCITCKKMEGKTFSDSKVHQVLRKVILLQADVTENNEFDRALLKKFNLYGPPAILFFNKQGFEEKSHRLIGFMKAEDFLRHVDGVIGE